MTDSPKTPAEFAIKYAHLQRVVCAANLMKDGRLILGARHWDTLMRNTFKLIYGESVKPCFVEQGFIDQWGNFLNRTEAYLIAKRQGQLIERAGSGPELYSEDIY